MLTKFERQSGCRITKAIACLWTFLVSYNNMFYCVFSKGAQFLLLLLLLTAQLLPHNWSWFATTRSSPPAAPPEGGTWKCVPPRDTSSMRRNSFSQKAIPMAFNRKHRRRLKGRPVGSQNSYGSCWIIFLPKQKTRKVGTPVQITLLWLAKFVTTIQTKTTC